MNSLEFANKVKDIALNYKTVYAKGVIGSPISESLLKSKKKQYPEWYTDSKVQSLRKHMGAFGFDCVCLIKSVLWGWNGDSSATYGGADYKSNGVPDITADTMIYKCSEISSDFSDIEVGEVVWMKGHIGVYIGNGLAVECTPKWTNNVQITACNCTKQGYNTRKWTKHGKLPYVDYPVKTNTAKPEKEISVKLKQLEKGSKGNQVKTMQRLLIGKGISCGKSGADGSFGNDTARAVKEFQKSVGITVDGSCGVNTWTKLLN
jgi:hypothetical protein